MLTGLSIDNVRFSATETPMLGLEPRPMEDLMAAMSSGRPPRCPMFIAKAKTARRYCRSRWRCLGRLFLHVVRAGKTQYMQVIQFPETARTQAAAIRDDFFNSFKITKP